MCIIGVSVIQAPLSMGILQARILEWVPCPPPGDLPNPGIEPRSPALHADSLPAEPQGKTDFYFSLFRKDICELDGGVYLSLLSVQSPLL